MNNSQNCKDLVRDLLSKRAGPFSPLSKLFSPYLEYLREQTGLPDGAINEIIYNALHDLKGKGKCSVCGGETRLYEHRGGWAEYCSKTCMNSSASSRTKRSEITKTARESNISSERTRKKIDDTMLEKYGVLNPSHIPEVVDKREKTFIDRFGCTTPFKNEEVKQKIRATVMEKYGGSGTQSTEILHKILLTRRTRIFDFLSQQLPEWEVITRVEDWTGSHSQPIQLKHECGMEHSAFLWCGKNMFNPRCSKCHTSSRPQRKVVDFLLSLGIEPCVNDRSVIKPLELDIVIPSSKLAIEVNGLYYHGEGRGTPKNYHLIKTERAQDAGFQLLHFSDFEIANRWTAVQTMILAKLGYLPKLHARSCDIRIISATQAGDFLERYHLGGNCRSQVKLGLYAGDELVSVATFGKSRYEAGGVELLRYCSLAAVRGGASKLISFYTKNFSCDRIVSYADRRWSGGQLYESLGFTLAKIVKPGYWYFNASEFHHRSMFQKHRIVNRENSHLTEWQIMQHAGWDRYWDCGHLKYELIVGKNE